MADGIELADDLAALKVAAEVLPSVRAVLVVLRIVSAGCTETVLVFHTEADEAVAVAALGFAQAVVEEVVVGGTAV